MTYISYKYLIDLLCYVEPIKNMWNGVNQRSDILKFVSFICSVTKEQGYVQNVRHGDATLTKKN